MAKFQHRYGVPVRFSSLSEMLPYETIYRQKYARRMRSHLIKYRLTRIQQEQPGQVTGTVALNTLPLLLAA